MAKNPGELQVDITVKGDSNALAKLAVVEAGLKKVASSTEDHLKPLKGVVDEWDNLTDALGPATRVLGAAATGFAVVGAAVVGTGAALFAAAKQAADTGSLYVDLSEKTGLSAKTLSALDFAAQQTNSTIEDLAQGVVFFEKQIAAATRGSKEAKDALERLGIDPQEAIKDFEGALAKAFKTIYDAPEGIAKTTLSIDAFGRSGANLKGIIDAAQGSIPDLIKRAEELGVVFSERDAKAADEFGDNLSILTMVAKGAVNTFGKELFPVFIKGIQDFTKFLKDNKETFKGWGTETANVIRAIKAGFQAERPAIVREVESIGIEILKVVSGIKAIELAWKGLNIAGSQSIGEGVKQTQEQLQNPVGENNTAPIDEQTLREEAEKKRKEFEQERLKTLEMQLSEAKRLRESALGHIKDVLEKTGEVSKTAWQIYTDADRDAYATELELSRQRTMLRLQETDDELTKQEVIKQLLFERNSIYAQTKKRNDDLIKSLTQDSIQSQVAAAQQSIRLAEATSAKEIAALVATGATQEAITNLQIEKETDLFAKKKELLEREKILRANNANEVRRIENELQVLSEQRAKFDLEQEEKIFQARVKDLNKLVEISEKAKDNLMNLPLVGQGIAAQPTPTGKPKNLSDGNNVMGSFEEAISGNFMEAATEAQIIGETLTTMFGALANAVGGAVDNFIKFGTAGIGFRKFATEVISSVAQMAVVQAVWEAAQGAAMLALGFFTGNPKYFASATEHFTAAAIYGSIGAVATGIGRLAAGNSYSQGAGGGAGGGSDTAGANPNNADFTRTPLKSASFATTQINNNSGLQNEVSGLRATISELRETVSRLSSMPHGVLVKEGIRQNPGLVSEVVDRELAVNNDKVTSLQRRLGFA